MLATFTEAGLEVLTTVDPSDQEVAVAVGVTALNVKMGRLEPVPSTVVEASKVAGETASCWS